jgi:hypothetical protein
VERYLELALDIALSPALWLSALFGVIYSVLFTLWRGGGLRQGARDLVAGVAGFATGQVLASLLPLPSPRVGEVHLLWGSVFAVLFLLVGRRLWRPRPKPAPAAPGSTLG